MNVLPALMLVTLMPSVKILLDLTLVPAKSVLQEMEKHVLVRFLLWLNDQLFQKEKKSIVFVSSSVNFK